MVKLVGVRNVDPKNEKRYKTREKIKTLENIQ